MNLLKLFLNKVLDLLFPKRCICCDEILTKDSPYSICSRCYSSCEFLKDAKKCTICSSYAEDGDLCALCKVRTRNFTKNISAVSYSGAMKDAIIGYKFHNRPENYRAFGELLYDTILCEYGSHYDILASVPIHKERQKVRGYNQSDLLAGYLSKKLQKPYVKDGIVKIKNIPPQSSIKNPEDRLKNVKGAFRIENKALYKNKTVLLIDDVFTTGATIDEISHILLKSGAKAIYSATIAVAKNDKS